MSIGGMCELGVIDTCKHIVSSSSVTELQTKGASEGVSLTWHCYLAIPQLT